MIEIEALHKRLGATWVLRGIDLEVLRGEIVALVGPSGAGKSVLLKHIVGLTVPDHGSVLVDGRSVGDAGARELADLRRHMGYVFQDTALLDWLDVQDNLRLALGEGPDAAVSAATRARVREALARVNLPESVLPQLPAQLSGGMRKRAGVARAIVNSPAIVLFDEPTTGLDPQNVAAINQVILRVRQELGATSIVVTHDMGAVAAVADRVALLLDGRIHFAGTTAEFFNGSDHMVRAFTGGACAHAQGGAPWRAMQEAGTN